MNKNITDENIDTFDHDKWSRQLRTYGLNITQKLLKLKILIIGLRGYGVEIAKNLILSNPKEVAVYDNSICEINDLGSNFFLTEDDVKKKIRRDEASLRKLCQLNPTTKIFIENDYLSKINYFDVIIITEFLHSNIIEKINNECHANNKGFIYTLSLGVMSLIFSDFGNKHIILQKSGNEKKKFYITNITKDNKGILKLDLNKTNDRPLDKGYFIIKEVEGMTELSNKPIYYEINEDYNDQFIIGDTSEYSDYINGGIAEEFDMPIEKRYETLKDNLMNPSNNMTQYDYSKNKKGRKQLIHLLFIVLQEYFNQKGKLPDLNNEKESKIICAKVEDFYKTIKLSNNEFFKKLPDFNEDLIKDLIKFSKANHPCLCSFMGGFASQEVIKYTGLYTPLDQWFWIDIYDETLINLKNVNRSPLDSRYDDLIAIYGQEFLQKLHKSNLFLIGAGAVGCEYLKILSLLGVSTDKNAKVIVTDNDSIENSNLNRQFFFRKEHIGQSKSLIACNSVKNINPEFNCEGYQLEVRAETENTFNENFYKKLDFVLIAVDNIKARNYINNQCTLNKIKLIECGTLGEQASSQLIIPFVTEEYKGKEINNKVAMCTLKFLPSLIEHCIEWGKERFFEYFVNNIKNLIHFIENPEEFFENNQGNDLYNKLLNIYEYLHVLKSKSYDKCLNLAKKTFYINYNKIIKDMLKINPENSLCQDGSKFWKGSNRLPHTLEYNSDNIMMYNYIDYFAFLLADSLGIPINNDLNYKKKYIDLIKVEINENPNENEENLKNKLRNIFKNNFKDYETKNIHEQIFEKDHDDNHHIDFIYNASNLRANNFRIENCSRDKAKFIAGNIVPSIPTTTASIVGFISSQIFTLLQTTEIEHLRQINIDLSTPFFLIFKPKKASKKKECIDPLTKIKTSPVPYGFTCWDHIEIEGNKTVNEVIDYINEKYNVDVTGLYTLNSINIIQDNYDIKFENAYFNAINNHNISQQNIYFKVLADVKNSDDHVVMPKFKYIIINS